MNNKILIGSTFSKLENQIYELNKFIEILNNNFNYKIKYISPFDNIDGAYSVFSKTMNNIYQGYISSELYKKNLHFGYYFFSSIPFGLNIEQFNLWMKEDGKQLWDELNSRFGLKGFIIGNTEFKNGIWSNIELNNLDDLKNIKIKINQMGIDILKNFDSDIINISLNNLNNYLNNDKINSLQSYGDSIDEYYELNKKFKYLYKDIQLENFLPIVFVMNKDFYDSLEDKEKELVETICKSYNNNFNLLNGVNLSKFEKNIKYLPDDIINELKNYTNLYIKNMVNNSDELCKKIYCSYYTFKNKVNPCNNIIYNRIQGVVKYIDLEGGFYGMITNDKNYLPINIQLELNALDNIIINSYYIINDPNIYQWGIQINVIDWNVCESENECEIESEYESDKNIYILSNKYKILVNIDKNNNLIFDNKTYNSCEYIGLSYGTYTIYIPVSHPIGFLSNDIEIINVINGFKKGTYTVNENNKEYSINFYWGDITFIVKNNFNIVSYYTFCDGYCGGKNKLKFCNN